MKPAKERGRLRLRTLLGGLAVAALIAPVVLAVLVGVVIASSMPKAPIFRFQSVGRELALAVDYADGVLSIRPGYKPPLDLRLVIEGPGGVVLLSNVDRIRSGAAASLDDIVFVIDGKDRVKNFFTENVRDSGGAVIGSYYAWFSDDYQPQHRGAIPVGLLALIGFCLFAFCLGVIVSTFLGRSVLKLERAAGRIAAGDLETEVHVSGIREIEELSLAMDGMRAALREDRDKRARFLAGISHDLRTPLTSIGGYLEAVEDGLASDPDTLRRYVHIMRGKTRLLEGRIASLIEFARMETGEWRMGFEEIELRPFLEGLAREFREDSRLMDRGFSFDLSALEGLRAGVDRALLSRAFENLFSNAIRYSPPGSAARMAAKLEGAVATIDFDDEGPGIAPAERERVFEAFVRGGTAGGGEGLGLGLYIARSVIQGHGWSIRADATPDGCGRLSVVIPLATQA
jgi:signal transduction histidine kinase